MFNEPLKGKKDILNCLGEYHEKNIKSAVEWLKKSMEYNYKKKNKGSLNGFQNRYGDTLDLIDEAFEDVVKDV